MTYEKRGTFEYHDRATQLISFDGMKFAGNITPTDIDGFIEYHGKSFLFLEIKHGDAQVPSGQQIAYERAVDAMQKAGKESVAFVARHDVDDPKQDVIAATCHVDKFYYKGKWWNDNQQRTVKEAVDAFLKMVDSQGA